ncbi:60S acidic ribosomal protein P2, putative [Cryptosporidium muris RN66]|uniref:60S acidic ribosomal protein P2, putative n=1 Tax=Cryptosporidium muris (strain RN66) TaxID=441375 RepID=B6AE73_CRYMR|nr:60S acidic ribosomal protein P2, putative [Cryptosporidium muris RN66]EEA06514.1 60S acidic ribosomal protein P2, putative [Cryptosporidium muris RN66]|eukprot:XP_002140863.1 60S acidic ribosomal protein P2 [Cryptosporidium muris RN66]
MSMKYVAAYLLCVTAGNESPSLKDISSVLSSVGIECDEEIINVLIKNMQGHLPHEVIASGLNKLQTVSASSNVTNTSGTTASTDPNTAVAPVKEEEEEEEADLGFSLFD